MGVSGNGDANGSDPRWFLVIQPAQRELYDLLRERLQGTDVEVILDRRERERRRGSLGPAMDRRSMDRRRQRPIGLVAAAASRQPGPATVTAKPGTAATPARAVVQGPATHRCPTCLVMLEMEMPRFPHPPARVDMEIGHFGGSGSGQDPQHVVEIAAFTISGRILLSQRLPARIQR